MQLTTQSWVWNDMEEIFKIFLLLGLFLLLGGLNLLFMELDKHVSKNFKYVTISKNRVEVLMNLISSSCVVLENVCRIIKYLEVVPSITVHVLCVLCSL